MNLQRVLSSESIEVAKRKLTTIEQLAKNQKRQCILTKGGFDLLHYGHLSLFHYIDVLKSKFNLPLVVALASDDLIKRKKGNKRPINDAFSRQIQIALLPQVDFICINDDDNLVGLIQQLSPQFYVKGVDTAGNEEDEGIMRSKNPEFKHMPDDSTVIIFEDDGEISTSALIARISKMDVK